MLVLIALFVLKPPENMLKLKAKDFCDKENVDSVYTCDEYIRVVSSLLGGGSTFYKLDSTGSLEEGILCPVVALDWMSEECRSLIVEPDCKEKKVC